MNNHESKTGQSTSKIVAIIKGNPHLAAQLKEALPEEYYPVKPAVRPLGHEKMLKGPSMPLRETLHTTKKVLAKVTSKQKGPQRVVSIETAGCEIDKLALCTHQRKARIFFDPDKKAQPELEKMSQERYPRLTKKYFSTSAPAFLIYAHEEMLRNPLELIVATTPGLNRLDSSCKVRIINSISLKFSVQETEKVNLLHAESVRKQLLSPNINKRIEVEAKKFTNKQQNNIAYLLCRVSINGGQGKEKHSFFIRYDQLGSRCIHASEIDDNLKFEPGNRNRNVVNMQQLKENIHQYEMRHTQLKNSFVEQCLRKQHLMLAALMQQGAENIIFTGMGEDFMDSMPHYRQAFYRSLCELLFNYPYSFRNVFVTGGSSIFHSDRHEEMTKIFNEMFQRAKENLYEMTLKAVFRRMKEELRNKGSTHSEHEQLIQQLERVFQEAKENLRKKTPEEVFCEVKQSFPQHQAAFQNAEQDLQESIARLPDIYIIKARIDVLGCLLNKLGLPHIGIAELFDPYQAVQKVTGITTVCFSQEPYYNAQNLEKNLTPVPAGVNALIEGGIRKILYRSLKDFSSCEISVSFTGSGVDRQLEIFFSDATVEESFRALVNKKYGAVFFVDSTSISTTSISHKKESERDTLLTSKDTIRQRRVSAVYAKSELQKPAKKKRKNCQKSEDQAYLIIKGYNNIANFITEVCGLPAEFVSILYVPDGPAIYHYNPELEMETAASVATSIAPQNLEDTATQLPPRRKESTSKQSSAHSSTPAILTDLHAPSRRRSSSEFFRNAPRGENTADATLGISNVSTTRPGPGRSLTVGSLTLTPSEG